MSDLLVNLAGLLFLLSLIGIAAPSLVLPRSWKPTGWKAFGTYFFASAFLFLGVVGLDPEWRAAQQRQQAAELAAGRSGEREANAAEFTRMKAEIEARAATPESRRRAAEERAAADEADALLELTDFQWSRSDRYATVEGMVKNRSDRPLPSIQAVAIFTDDGGNFVTSDDALIEYNPLLPGQSSPFKVMARWNPAMESCRVEFKKLFGGKIATKYSWRK